MIGAKQRIGHMTVVGHPTNLDVWSVSYIKFSWCCSLPITTLALGHVSVGVRIISVAVQSFRGYKMLGYKILSMYMYKVAFIMR